MALTPDQLNMVANAALDYYFNRGTVFQQSLQERPMVRVMEANAKSFPGGKGNIDLAVQGVFGNKGTNDTLKGYTADDTVNFYNPTNLARANYPWREHHIGLTVTHTELKHDGLSVSDEWGNTSNHSGRDQTMLVNLFDTKLFDFGEQYARSLNLLLWGDGTADAKGMAGVQLFLSEDPSVGTVGGINRATAGNGWWRNRARTAAFKTKIDADATLKKYGGDAVTPEALNGGALWTALQEEHRQLRRYGGRPNTFLAGSEFVAALEYEMRANGYYSTDGFNKSMDGAVGQMLFDGTRVEYDPTLDDAGLSKRGYWFDNRHIFLMKMTDEWRRTHKPSRPTNQFVLHRSITSTGQVVATQCNSGLVIDIK